MKLPLSVSLVLAALAYTHASVYDNFNHCLKYFYKGEIPSGFQAIALPDLFDRNNFPDGMNQNDLGSPAYICQTYENTVRFATLYDRGRLMPLYSAYIMDVKPQEEVPSECSRFRSFQYEPQLIFRGVDGNMILKGEAINKLDYYSKSKGISLRLPKNQGRYLLQTSQAGDEDYTDKDYDRGHLNPCGHHKADKDRHRATFTFTNVVPMLKELNNKFWNQYESDMIKISTQCKDMYVVVGIVPGNSQMEDSRLYAPAYVWNAYCCVDNNDKPTKSGAALAANVKNGIFQIFEKIDEFQTTLKGLLGVYHDIEIFFKNCKP